MTTITDRFGETAAVSVDRTDGGVALSGDVLLNSYEARELIAALTAAVDALDA